MSMANAIYDGCDSDYYQIIQGKYACRNSFTIANNQVWFNGDAVFTLCAEPTKYCDIVPMGEMPTKAEFDSL